MTSLMCRPPALLRRWVCALGVGAAAVVLPAQPRAQSAFVQGSYGPDVRRFSGDDSDRVFDSESNNLTLTAGGFLLRHLTAAVEIDLGAGPTESRTVSVTIAGRPATITTSYTLRRRTVSALAGLHSAPVHRVRLAVYAGVSFSSVTTLPPREWSGRQLAGARIE